MSPGSVAAQLLWFGGNAKSTLCGLQATRYVNVFTPSEASCWECRKRWQLAVAGEQARAQREANLRQRQAERQQQYRDMPGLHRTAEDVTNAGGSLYAAVKYESGSDRWRRHYLSRHDAVAGGCSLRGYPQSSSPAVRHFDNHTPKCRHDHRLKQHPRWKVDQLPDGTFRWTTPAGRIYTTEPTRYPI